MNIATRFQTGDFPFPMVDLLDVKVEVISPFGEAWDSEMPSIEGLFLENCQYAPKIDSSESLVFFFEGNSN